jgi:hypothetical protein
MILAVGLCACLALWWFSQNRVGVKGLVAALPRHRIAGWAALLLAGMLLLRGNLILAAVFGIGALWAIEGPEWVGRRVRRMVPARAGRGRSLRTRWLVMAVGEDGRVAGGRVRGGPLAGAPLDALDPPSLVRLRDLCRAEDPAGVPLLEAYLDRRAPGWRVDAEADRHPGPGGAAKPGAMTQEEAYEILGLERGAPTEQIRSAHRTLMKRAHPDQGGSAEGAARLNAARDRLLSRHR